MNDIETTDAPIDPQAKSPQMHRFSFLGSGSEYFRIWAVNLLLTFVSAGLYSPWAKVRREQYFARNTRVAHAGFDYHGNPLAILKGRLILYGLLLLSSFGHPLLNLAVLLCGIALLPWMIQRSIRFRLRNTSYRNIRFGFVGPITAFYKFALVGIASLVVITVPLFAIANWSEQSVQRMSNASVFLLVAISVILAPLVYLLSLSALRLFVVRFARWGTAEFSATLDRNIGWQLLRAQLLPLMVGALVLAASIAVLGPAIMLAIPLVFVGGRAYLQARIHNIVWNDTQLEGSTFHANLSEWRYTVASVKWLVLTVLTLGLYRPWAIVHQAQMKADSLMVRLTGSVDDVSASAATGDSNAFGQEASEWFDLDLSL